jgi:hypothetical protein
VLSAVTHNDRKRSSDVRCHIKYWPSATYNTNATWLALLHGPVGWEVALLFCICMVSVCNLYLKTGVPQILLVICLNSWVDSVDIKLGQDFLLPCLFSYIAH